MKTIFTLLSFFALSLSALAVPTAAAPKPKSALTIRSADQGDIRVVLDGRRFEPNDNSIVIGGLEPGTHTLKIYREKNTGLFNIFGKRYEMVYNTSVLIRSRTNLTVVVDRFGRASITEQKMNKGRQRNDRDWDRDSRYRDFDFDRDGKFGDYDRNYGYERGMDDREFRSVVQAIDKEWLETNKLKSATQIVKTNRLTSAQVKTLVLMFGFEANKLELAKQAYHNTVDKQNYHMINDAFSFKGSKDELNRYIRTYH